MLTHQIRKYAIHRLSTDFVLSPIEKIHLARAHKVATWLDEGVNNLVSGGTKPTLYDLGTLGWETAAQILWIRDNPMPEDTLHFRRDLIKCGYCSSSDSLMDFAHNCPSCRRDVPADAVLTAPGPGTMSGPTERIIYYGTIQCSYLNCRRSLFPSISRICLSCSVNLGSKYLVRITPKGGLKEMIEEIFGEEIRNYEAA